MAPPRYAAITLGNTNEQTFETVLGKIMEIFKEKNTKDRETVVHLFIIDTKESYNKTTEVLNKELSSNYRDINIIITRTIIDIVDKRQGLERMVLISEIITKLYDKKNIFVDITNGPKEYSSALYAIASILEIDNIYKLQITDNKYVKVQRLHNIPKLSKVGNFEIIYYLTELEKTFEPVKHKIRDSSFLDYAYTKIKEGIILYFSKNEQCADEQPDNCDFEMSLLETVRWVGKAIEILYKFLDDKKDRILKEPLGKQGIKEYKKLENITNKLEEYEKQIKQRKKEEQIEVKELEEIKRELKEIEEDIEKLKTKAQLRKIKLILKDNNVKENVLKFLRGIPLILELLWEYRHIPAHQAEMGYYMVSQNEARIAIEASLEFFRRVFKCEELTKFMIEIDSDLGEKQ